MASRAGHDLPSQLTPLLRFGVVGDLSDGQLVERFLTARDGADQAAFTALVERHGPMVLGVCRKVLGNAHAAEDALQATFLVLARKAGSVRKADSLAGWLHRVARRAAMQAKAEAARRRAYEQRSAAMKAVQLERQGGSLEGWPELHEAIARLPERYREPVVLCYLEGFTTEEAALRIGCPHGTILSRLSRARDRLRGRLERCSFASSTTLLTAGLKHRAMEALPARLLDTTVRAAVGFVGRQTSGAGLASASAMILAKGVLHTMAVSKLKILVAMALTCGFAWGGVQTFGQLGGVGGGQEPVGAAPGVDERQDALTRSVETLQSELDKSTRRNAEMQKALEAVRADLKAQPAGSRRSAATRAAIRLAEAINADSAQAVARLVEQLKRNPVQPTATPDRVALYMMDLTDGEVTLIADQPAPGLTFCGSPVWSHDGRRILFDATPGMQFSLTRLMSIGPGEGRPAVTDLGPGNCPAFSPADDRIAFLSNADGSKNGVWLMKADGSDRRHLGTYGIPRWSPDGRQMMILSFSHPRQVTLIDADPEKSGDLYIPGHQIFSVPSWAGPGTIVATIVSVEGDALALIDVSDPGRGKVKEVLWKSADGLDLRQSYPIYSPGDRRCVFVGGGPRGMALYAVRQGKAGPPERLSRQRESPKISGLAPSPDGRYVLYSVQGPDRPEDAASGGQAPGEADQETPVSPRRPR